MWTIASLGNFWPAWGPNSNTGKKICLTIRQREICRSSLEAHCYQAVWPEVFLNDDFDIDFLPQSASAFRISPEPRKDSKLCPTGHRTQYPALPEGTKSKLGYVWICLVGCSVTTSCGLLRLESFQGPRVSLAQVNRFKWRNATSPLRDHTAPTLSARSGLTLKASISLQFKKTCSIQHVSATDWKAFGVWAMTQRTCAFFLPLQAAHLKCRYKTQTCFVYLCIVVFYVSEQQLKHSSEGLRLKHVTVLSL